MITINRSRILILAWPIIVSNLSTPLLGLVDTAVIGHLGDPALIGGVAIGGLIFSFLFWGFGFLRMGTTGLVAQARGENNVSNMKACFFRAFLVGLFLGLGLVILQSPLINLALYLLSASVEVESAARLYFDIRIWSAPFNLANLAITGFLLGQQNTKSILLIQLLLNGTNILLDLIFVVVMGLGISGAAYATVTAEILGFAVGLYFVLSTIKLSMGQKLQMSLAELLAPKAIKQMFGMNRDIMIRTLCLLFAFAWFTNRGATAGNLVLAANTILMQFLTFSAFFLDGFALTAEMLVGDAIGAKQLKRFRSSIYYCSELAFITSISLSIAFYLLGPYIIIMLTNIPEVQSLANDYLFWLALSPILSVSCYLLDGIFIGALRSTEMRNAMIISLLVFLVAVQLLEPQFSNHGLWAALQIYFLARAISLAAYWKKLLLPFHRS